MTHAGANDLLNQVTKSLSTGRERDGSLFISTSVAYPNGVGVIVRIDREKTGYTVSDDGYAAVIAEGMGTLNALVRIASGVAKRTGVSFDRGSFFLAGIEEAALPVAVTTIANASAQAMERCVAGLEQPRLKRSRDVFDKRLRAAFGDSVAFDCDFRGATGRPWAFSAGVQASGRVVRLFELVSPSTQAVAMAQMKISDVRALPSAPIVTAALVDYDKTEPALRSILSTAGGVVIAARDDVSRYTLVA